MITVTQCGQYYTVKFPYDPAVVDMVKCVPGRSWDPTAKVWTIHKDKLGTLLSQFKGTVYEGAVRIISQEHINENASLDTTAVIPNVDLSNVPFYVQEGAHPYKHQLDFMKYAIHRWNIGYHSGFLLGDDPGLGKTVEVMNWALYHRRMHKFKHCLIICCIASSKYNWYKDIVKHSRGHESPYILGTRLKRDKKTERYNTGNAERLQDIKCGHMYGDESAPELPYFLITNIETFRMREKKKYPITDEVKKLIQSGYFSMIAIDEVHKNMSTTSMQGKQILELKRYDQHRVEWIPMTGTPITSKPTDLFTPLKLIDAHSYGDFYTWSKHFCLYGGFSDKEVVGYKNIPELKNMLQSNMLRRLKKDVLDLPPKIYYTDYVDNTSYQNSLYNKVATNMIKSKGTILSQLNPLAQFMKLRQVNGAPELVDPDLKVDATYLQKNAKIAKVLELLDEAVQHGEKSLVFSNWVEPLRTLYRFVSKRYKTCCFTGTMTDADREKHKRVFMNNPEYMVMIGTIGAMGTTHTLTAAQNVIFLDEPWVPSDKQQAEERAYRIGTKSTVSIHTIISKNTVDDQVHDILYTKQGVSNYIVDNHLDLRSNPELFDLLLRDSIS